MHDTPLNKLAAFNDSVSPDDIKLWKAACAVECDPSTDELVTLLKVCILSASNEACCRGMGASPPPEVLMRDPSNWVYTTYKPH